MIAKAPSDGKPAARGMPMSEVVTFSIAALGVASMLVMVDVHLPKYFATHVGVSLAAVGAAFALVRMLDVAVDFAVGAMMDRTKTRIGRFKPWLICATPVGMIAFYMLFFAPAGAGESYLIGWLLVYYCAYSVFVLGFAAYGATLAVTYHDRSKIFAWSQVLGVLGSAALLSVPPIVAMMGIEGEVESIHAMAFYLLALFPIAMGVTLIFTPERIAPETTRERFNLRELWSLVARPTMGRLFFVDLLLGIAQAPSRVLYLFFFHDGRGFTLTQANSLLVLQILSGLLGAPAAAWMAAKIGKHRTLILTAILFALAKIFVWFTPQGGVVWAGFGVFALGLTAASFLLLIRAMTADVGDEVRLEQGRERMGMLFAIVTTTTKVGSAATIALTFSALAWFGFNAKAGAVNDSQAILGLEVCYVFMPVVMALIAGALMLGYKLDARRHAEIRSALDERDAQVRAAAAAPSSLGLAVGSAPAKV